jgi:hypothetical protein
MLLLAAAPSLAGEGVIVQGGTLTQGAISSVLAFSNGRVVDARALVIQASFLRYDDRDLLIYEPSSRRTHVASDDVVMLALLAVDEAGYDSIGSLFDEPGVMVLFESPSLAGADPLLAERFHVQRPEGESALYLAPPDISAVPEPGMLPGLGAGAAMLHVLHARSRRRLRPGSDRG